MKELQVKQTESIIGYSQRIKSACLLNQLTPKIRDMLLDVTLAKSQQKAFITQFFIVWEEEVNPLECKPLHFENTPVKGKLAICRQCIDDGASHAAHLQLSQITYCDIHQELLTTQCPSCKKRVLHTNSRLCRFCYNILPKAPVSPSSQLSCLQELLVSKPDETSVLVNVLISLLIRPLDTFDTVVDLNGLTDKERFALMSYIATVIVNKRKFDSIIRAVYVQIDNKARLGFAHREAIKARWEAGKDLAEAALVSQDDIPVNSVKFPIDIFASLANVDVSEYVQKVEHSLVSIEHLPKLLGCNAKAIKTLVSRNVFKIYKKRRINGHYVDAYDVAKTLTKRLTEIDIAPKYYISLDQLNLKTLMLFRASMADIIELIIHGNLKGFLCAENAEAPLSTRIFVDKMFIETALTLHLLEPENEVAIDDFCKALAVPTEHFITAWELGKFCEWPYKPCDILTPSQVLQFFTKYESVRRLSQLIGCTERKVLSYIGEDIEGIVKTKFNDKNNPFVFLTLNMQNFKYIQDIKNKLLPSIKWQS
jgi:hypothetical protein